jgi:hypothetical protein
MPTWKCVGSLESPPGATDEGQKRTFPRPPRDANRRSRILICVAPLERDVGSLSQTSRRARVCGSIGMVFVRLLESGRTAAAWARPRFGWGRSRARAYCGNMAYRPRSGMPPRSLAPCSRGLRYARYSRRRLASALA